MSRLNPLTLPLEEVKVLTSQEGTCVKKRECKLTLDIHPMYAGDPKTGVRDRLNNMCSRYSKLLGGIPIAFEKIRLSSTGALLDTSPYIHTCVEGTFYVFSPEKDALLEGVVKKSSPSHLNCLIHKIFNVSVPRPQEVSSQDWEGSSVEEGDVVEIAITNVDMTFFLPMITGCLKRVVSRKAIEALDIFASNTSQVKKIFTDSGISSSDGEVEEAKPVVTEKKKKKRKSSDVIQDAGLTDSKKKKKEKKKMKEELYVADDDKTYAPDSSFKVSCEEFLGDLIGMEKSKKKKKRKSDLTLGNGIEELSDFSFKVECEEFLGDLVGMEKGKKKKKRKSDSTLGNGIEEFGDSSFKVECEEKPGDLIATEKPKKKKKKSDLSFDDGVAEFPGSLFKLGREETPEKTKKKKKKDLTISEAETDALFLSSLMAKEKTPVKASKKRKAEESPLSAKKKKKKKVED